MKILVSGASGLLGSALVPALKAAGHDVGRLVRDKSRAVAGDVFWDPPSGEIDRRAVDGCDAIINLAGENIAGRWTARKKRRIRDSRIDGTHAIAEALACAAARPRTLINASATGFYGDRGDELLDETSRAGRGDFLSEVCQAWESAAEPAARAGVRVVFQRFGVVLSGKGGALAMMLLPFRLGLGGRIGSGRQFMSWVTLDDAVGATLHNLGNDTLRGPINVVSPEPVTNLKYTKTLGRVLSRPTIFPMPAFAARTVLGQMADELLLASQRVHPATLLGSGYAFKYPQLEPALRHVLERG
jgi:hypothetical protein